MEIFWMVMKDVIGRDAMEIRRHSSLESAKIEAIRLVEQEDKTFFVLEATMAVSPVKKYTIENLDEPVPF